jgi:hypothetical protein
MERNDECATSARDRLARSLEVMPFVMLFELDIVPPQMF